MKHKSRKEKIDLLKALAKGEKMPDDVIEELCLHDSLLALIPSPEKPVLTQEDITARVKVAHGQDAVLIKKEKGYLLLNAHFDKTPPWLEKVS